MSLFFPSEDDPEPRWDDHMEDLRQDELARRRRQARDANCMAETGEPFKGDEWPEVETKTENDDT